MAEPQRILVVEDEAPVRSLLRDCLEAAGFEVQEATDGRGGLRCAQERPPDLVLLDLALPGGMGGLDVVRTLRGAPATRSLPVIVLTGQPEERTEPLLLEAGADDYIRKTNFRPALLVSRIRAVLRRVTVPSQAVVRTDHLTIDPERRDALVDGRPISLTPTEFDILYRLASNRDRALDRRELLDRGGSEDEGAEDRSVDVHVLSIRRKLGRNAWLVSTVYGKGYKLGITPGD